MKDKKIDMVEATETKEQKIKIKFNQPVRNIRVTDEMVKNAQKEYFKIIVEEHGRKIALPNENYMIMLKVEELYGEPMMFLTGITYEVSAIDAEHYLSLTRTIIDSETPIYIANVERDIRRYQGKYHLAERVVA